MAQPPLFRSALGETFDHLAPVLRRHYDLAPGHEVAVQGAMDAWNRLAWARAFASFMPVPGKNVPVFVRNRGLVDRGEVCYEWDREFRNRSGISHSYTLTRPAPIAKAGQATLPCVLDTFNQPANIGVTLALEVSVDGQSLKQMTVGPQYAIRGEKYVSLPGLFHIRSVAIERALDDRTIQTEVVVSHPLFGNMFGYSGVLTVA